MAVKHPTKEELVQRQVIQAAQKLFQEHGIQDVTMEDVAKAVGKAKSSLYYYYQSKDEICDAVMDVEITEMLTEITRAVDHAETIEQKIHAFCITKIRTIRKRRALYHITYDAGSKYTRTKPNYNRRRKYLAREGAVLSQIITDGIEKGELRPLDKKEQDVLVFVLLSGLHGLEKEMVIEKGYNLDPAIDTLSNVIIHGLKNRD